MNGISEQECANYWVKRSEKQGYLTVGCSGNNTEAKQDAEYQVKQKFVVPYLLLNVPTVDYGCGVGRWSDIFDKKLYVGMDITSNLLEEAISRNPEKTFSHLATVNLSNVSKDVKKALQKCSQFFSCCVLQHCDDKLVGQIFANLYSIKPKGIRFVLYENKQVKVNHVAGRTGEEYLNLLEQAGYEAELEYHTHTVHDEEHGVSILQT